MEERFFNAVQYINKQKHSINHTKVQIIKYNTWQVKTSYMFQRPSVIFRDSATTKEYIRIYFM